MSEAIAAQSFAQRFSYQAARVLTELRPERIQVMVVSSPGNVAVSLYHAGSILPFAESDFEIFSGGRSARFGNARAKVVDLLPSRFAKLVVDWKKSKGPISSITAMAMMPAYQEIIGMGKPAVSLILSQLRSEGDQPDMWFWALKAITGIDPVHEDDRGDMVAMAKAWLEWGSVNSVS